MTPAEMKADGEARQAPDFLSETWFEDLRASVRAGAARHLGAVGALDTFSLGVLITEVPWADGGEFAYTVLVAAEADVSVGTCDDADVVLVGSHVSMRALADGTESVGALLEAGAVKVRGDVSRLLAAADMISVLSSAPAQRRSGAADAASRPPPIPST